jgi:nucleoside-diphosphate-sugar epimerase
MNEGRRRIAVLGCTGYLGSRLVTELLKRSDVELVLGVGRRPTWSPAAPHAQRFAYAAATLPSTDLTAVLGGRGIDSVIHCVFVSSPGHDATQARQTNVTGAACAITAAGRAGVRHFVLISSVAVYGPRREETPLSEQAELHPNAFQFSRDKYLQELGVRQAQPPGTRLTILRPCTVVGSGAHNFLLDFLRWRYVPVPSGADPHWQFLHELDFCRATIGVVNRGVDGVFNVTPDDSIPLRSALRALGSRPVPIPRRLLSVASNMSWRFHLPRLAIAPPSAVEFMLSAPVASNHSAREALQLEFLHTSSDALAALRHG